MFRRRHRDRSERTIYRVLALPYKIVAINLFAVLEHWILVFFVVAMCGSIVYIAGIDIMLESLTAWNNSAVALLSSVDEANFAVAAWTVFEPVVSILTIVIAMGIWYVDVTKEWRRSLPKRLTVHFMLRQHADGVPIEIMQAHHIPLEGEIREWLQAVGRQMGGYLNFDINIRFPQPIIEIGGEGFWPIFYSHYELEYFLSDVPDKLYDKWRSKGMILPTARGDALGPASVAWQTVEAKSLVWSCAFDRALTLDKRWSTIDEDGYVETGGRALGTFDVQRRLNPREDSKVSAPANPPVSSVSPLNVTLGGLALGFIAGALFVASRRKPSSRKP